MKQTLRRFCSVMTVFAMLLTVLFVPGTNITTETSSAASSGFSVKGTTLYDANGNPFVMRGTNHAYVWYKGKEETALKAIAATGANTVRIVLGCGGAKQNNPFCSESELGDIIKLCEQNKLIAVLEVHDATGSDSIDDLQTVTNYWLKVKNALVGHEDTVILNIANEWVGTWDSDVWKNGYTKVIPQLRDAGIRNTIMVDAAGWGQYAEAIEQKGKEVFASDKLANTMFSVHMYGYAGGSDSKVKSVIDGVNAQGLCLIVGEFGINHSDGNVAYQSILDYCTQTNTGYLSWSWKGNSGGVEYLDMVNDWEGTSLTEQGKAIIEGQNGIRATSKICSVFGSSNNNNNNNDNNNDQNTDNNNLNGDVNNDGVVTAVDLTLLMQYMVGKAQLSNEKSDVNNDGIVNIVDIISLKNSLL